ncbi:MAG: low specificity L-threonine aldolase, partial [Propioniciclava sp.]
IVVVPTGDRPAGQVVAEAATRGVALSAVGGRVVRAVTHLDVTAAECTSAGEVVAEILSGAFAR